MNYFPYSDIPTVQKGSRPTLLEADLANEVIGALNLLKNMTIESGTEDVVNFDSSGVQIIYKGASSDFDFSGTIEMLDANDITQKVSMTFKDGKIESITTGSSGYSTQTIDICEGGETQSVEFVTVG